MGSTPEKAARPSDSADYNLRGRRLARKNLTLDMLRTLKILLESSILSAEEIGEHPEDQKADAEYNARLRHLIDWCEQEIEARKKVKQDQ